MRSGLEQFVLGNLGQKVANRVVYVELEDLALPSVQRHSQGCGWLAGVYLKLAACHGSCGNHCVVAHCRPAHTKWHNMTRPTLLLALLEWEGLVCKCNRYPMVWPAPENATYAGGVGGRYSSLRLSLSVTSLPLPALISSIGTCLYGCFIPSYHMVRSGACGTRILSSLAASLVPIINVLEKGFAFW